MNPAIALRRGGECRDLQCIQGPSCIALANRRQMAHPFKIGRDQPVFSNPFAEPTLRDKLKQTGESLIEKSGEALEKGGKALQQKAQENQ